MTITHVNGELSHVGEAEAAIHISKRPTIGSDTSWGQFQFAKHLSLITPRYDESTGSSDNNDSEDEHTIFSMFNWSKCAGAPGKSGDAASDKTAATSALSSDDTTKKVHRRGKSRSRMLVRHLSSHTIGASITSQHLTMSDDEGGVSGRRRRFLGRRYDSSTVSSDQLSDDGDALCDLSCDGAGFYKQRGDRKHKNLHSCPDLPEGYQHQEPARATGRAARRSSLPISTSSWAEIAEPRRSSGRAKRRGSVSKAHTSPREPVRDVDPARLFRRAPRRKSKDYEPDPRCSVPRRRSKAMAHTVDLKSISVKAVRDLDRELSRSSRKSSRKLSASNGRAKRRQSVSKACTSESACEADPARLLHRAPCCKSKEFEREEPELRCSAPRRKSKPLAYTVDPEPVSVQPARDLDREVSRTSRKSAGKLSASYGRVMRRGTMSIVDTFTSDLARGEDPARLFRVTPCRKSKEFETEDPELRFSAPRRKSMPIAYSIGPEHAVVQPIRDLYQELSRTSRKSSRKLSTNGAQASDEGGPTGRESSDSRRSSKRCSSVPMSRHSLRQSSKSFFQGLHGYETEKQDNRSIT